MNEPVSLLSQWRMVKQASVDPRLRTGGVAVLIAILDRMNDAGVCWPSITTIASDAEKSRPTAVRAVKQLVELGYLIRESGTRTTSNRYRMGSAARCTDEPTARCSGEPTGRCTDEPGVGAAVIPQVGAEMNLELASLNLPNEPTQKRARARTTVSVDLPAWLPADAWGQWIGHRKEVGRKFTVNAQEIAIRKLEALRADGHDPRKLIELAIESGWSSFNPRESTKTAGRRTTCVGAIPRDDRTDDEIDADNRAQLARFGMEVTA